MRGEMYQAKHEFDKAIADYTAGINMTGSDASLYALRARVYLSKREYDKAIADASKAIGLGSKDTGVYQIRGGVYGQKGDYARAIGDYTQALTMDPRNAHLHYNRCISHYRKGDYNEAVTDCSNAAELDPKDEYIRVNLLIVLRKTSRQRVADYANSLRAFVSSNASTAWIRILTKYVLGMDGVTETKVLEKARLGKGNKEIQERLCEAYYYVGEQRLWQGDRKGAEEFFRKSIETNQSNFEEYVTSKAMLENMRKGKL